MDFSGPEAADYANVRSLNAVFLALLCSGADGAALRGHLPAEWRPVAQRLTDVQQERLASAPYLLMSFRERDAELWESLLDDGPEPDLFAATPPAAIERLTVAGIGFLWLLACRNPFAARLISGAGLDWCERLTDTTLIHLVHAVTGHADLLIPRTAGRYEVWPKLLDAGLSGNPSVREAAHLSVLQAMLTSGAVRRYRLRNAACSAQAPALTVHERRGQS